MISHEDTIAGIATALGEAGVSIIRISGEQALPLTQKIFKAKSGKPIQQIINRVLTYGWIESEGQQLDEALLCIMRRPNSFTAEDVVELHCHGGVYLTRVILNLVLDAGARMANPGEFTQRAFLNGRIDLTQAEATNDLIRAKSQLELDLVINQLKGKLFQRITNIKEQIFWVLAVVNADIDFPEEDQIFAPRDQVDAKLTLAKSDLMKLIGSADTGIKIREGFKIVLTGKPNVGKSSILNGLLEESRAIVNQRPGTTRDTIEESCTIGGIAASLIDTAGIQPTTDVIEQEGISRALAAVERADLILWVIDMV
ncbi:MAG: tRNA uridine-5-carboxymethylaminomethyl(34) synthesis GTPase MnmE, partial [SAR324 cluster bacterium]|nr:tRNA uridine-5-carboxymethylaminomethyl(34) synthesis GTPase MnmE [SAR324 cluster bacterium]